MKKKLNNDDSDVENETRTILETEHNLLQSCFVCGKLEPDGASENLISWVSCSNSTHCKAWAHIQCSSGVGTNCSICNLGLWQFEEP